MSDLRYVEIAGEGVTQEGKEGGGMAAQPLFFNRPVKNRVEKGRKGGTQHLENIRGHAMALVEGLGESG